MATRSAPMLCLFLSACGNAASLPDEMDLYAVSGVDISGERGGFTYAEFDEERDRSRGDVFEGFGCLGSCAGHEAGWDWAAEHELADFGDCTGDSWSFIEGCAALVIANHEAHDPPERPERGLY